MVEYLGRACRASTWPARKRLLQAPACSALVCTFGNQQHLLYGDDFGGLHDCWHHGGANVWNLMQINGGGEGTAPGEQVACPPALPATGWNFVCRVRMWRGRSSWRSPAR